MLSSLEILIVYDLYNLYFFSHQQINIAIGLDIRFFSAIIVIWKLLRVLYRKFKENDTFLNTVYIKDK